MATNEEIKELIFEKFHTLSITHGIKKVTMEMLAKECVISKKTVYKHFQNKDQLINSYIDQIVKTITSGFEQVQVIDDGPRETMYKYFDLIFEIVIHLPPAIVQDAEKYYPDIESKIVNLRHAFGAMFMKTIKSGIKSGDFKNIDPKFVEGFYMGAVNNVFNPEFFISNGIPVHETLKSFKSMLLTGILKDNNENNTTEP